MRAAIRADSVSGLLASKLAVVSILAVLILGAGCTGKYLPFDRNGDTKAPGGDAWDPPGGDLTPGGAGDDARGDHTTPPDDDPPGGCWVDGVWLDAGDELLGGPDHCWVCTCGCRCWCTTRGEIACASTSLW